MRWLKLAQFGIATCSLSLACAAVEACGGGVGPEQHADDAGVTGSIGSSGGKLTASGVTLTIPSGALSTAVSISIAEEPGGTPAGYDALTALYRFSPEGLVFAVPVTVEFVTSASAGNAYVYWSRATGSGYDTLGTTWSRTVASALITHFSTGFVGSPQLDGGTVSTNAPDAGQPLDATNSLAVPADASTDVPSDSPTSGDATLPAVTDAATGAPGGDALVLYDGTPSQVVTDAGLGCTTPNGLAIRYSPMSSGYDGVHSYQVPTFVQGMDPSMLTWGSTDPSMVDIQPYAGRPGMMLTTKRAGDVTIIAFVNGTSTCGTAPLHIEAYTPAEWDLGNVRYNNGNPLTIAVSPGDAAVSTGDAACAQANPFESPPAACTNCHGTMSNGMLFGSTIFQDVQYTPEQTGGFSEADLTNVFVNGVVPPGGYFDTSIIDYCAWHAVHTWSDIDTPEKQKGMTAYLRSLTPMEQVGCFELFTAGSSMCSGGGPDAGTGD